jgi:hypothetical protein
MKRLYFAALAALMVASLVATFSPLHQTANAVSASDFDAGNLIQDRTFYTQSMSAAEIQAFLNSKIPSCTTGYTCLNTYQQSTPTIVDSYGLCGTYTGGTKVAAQIIYDVGQACGVNPEALLTLVQKESTLVTDNAPDPIQYRSATGYGCPDSAPCDSDYYGFFNQVYKAAWQYKYYQANANSFSYRAFRNNTILYNPNTSCGSANVTIENQATAGLYNYTPYQPNQAALNNLYGLGDSCSSYGNRNFWRIFSDWFGIDNKQLIRTVGSSDLYFTAGQYKWHVTSMDVAAEYGLGAADVAYVTQQTIDSIPTAPSPGYDTLNYFVKSDSDSDDDGGNIYLVSGQQRFLVTSMQEFADFGGSLSQLTMLPYYTLVHLPLVGNLSPFVKKSDGFVYKVSAGVKQGIFQSDYYNTLNPSGQISQLSDFIVTNTLTTGQPLINGAITLQGSDGRLWEASSSSWNYIPSMEIASCLGVSNNVVPFTSQQVVMGTQGANSSCIAKSQSDPTVYLLDNTKKYPLQSAWGLSNPVTLDGSLFTNKQTVAANSSLLVKSASDPSVYTLQNGTKRHVADGVALAEIDPTMTILSTNSNVLATLPTGPVRYSSGGVMSDPSGKLYVVNNDQLLYIPSMNLFAAYGLSVNNILRLSSSDVSAYTSAGTLSQEAIINGNSIIFDRGIALQVPASITAAYGFSGSTPTYLSGIARFASSQQATRYIKSSDSAQLYYMDSGTKRSVGSWSTWTSLGGTSTNITTLSPYTVSQIPNGTPF